MRTEGARRLPALVALLAFLAAACGKDRDAPPPAEPSGRPATAPVDPECSVALDESRPVPERMAAVARFGREGRPGAVAALRRLVKDRSQQAFLLRPEGGGFAVEANPFGEDPDLRAPLRTAAILALEDIGGHAPLLDLIAALFDRNPVVRNHAARALVRLGSRRGVEVLLGSLSLRIHAVETADRILREITAEDVDFRPDGGATRKAEAAGRWRAAWLRIEASGARLPLEGPPYRKGTLPELDREIEFQIDMLAQHQFLYMEQARRNLGCLGGVVVPYLEAALPKYAGRPQMRANAAEVLEAAGDLSARPLLVRLLSDPEPAVRSRAAHGLGRSHAADSVAELALALRDPDEGVVLEAARGLGRSGRPEALKALDDRAEAGALGAAATAQILLSRVRLQGASSPLLPAALDEFLAEDPDRGAAAEAWFAEWTGRAPERARPLTPAERRLFWREALDK